MQTATLVKKHISKKTLTYISFGAIALLTVLGIGLGFFIFRTTTRANEEAPLNISVKPAGSSAEVTWQTPVETIAVIEYGTQQDPSSFSEFAFSETPTTEHSVDMSALLPNTTYYFQIRIGETVYDNEGALWSFTTTASTVTDPDIDIPATTPSLSQQPTPALSATPSATLSPSPRVATVSATPVAVPTGAIDSCPYTDCPTVFRNLGSQCTTADYIQCLQRGGGPALPTAIPTTASTSTATSSGTITTATKTSCGIDYLQSNSCSSFTWTDVGAKNPACAPIYTKYFVQCKSNSFGSNDAATWYCNETKTDNNLTVPCGSAPTPAPGQSIFCRVRAETETGGAANATPWMYANTSCSRLSSSNSTCAISYLQGNNCKSWIWDRVNNTNPDCKSAFNNYTLQCTSNGDYTGATGTWYCDSASTNHYLDLPCYNAPTPADGATVQCRVRAEDGYGLDDHATSWVSSSAVCPTSTPTPTPSPTGTPTNTPTPTP